MEAFPRSKQLYMGLTLDSVSEIIWDVFKEFDEMQKIGLHFNNHKKIITHPNQGQIRLFGFDASEKEIKKVLGQKLRKVSIDEAGSFTIDLEKAVNQSIKPALIDLRPYSWLSLIGTPENIPNTYFQKVCDGLDKANDWSVHKWTAYDNPFVATNFKQEVDEMLANEPDIVNASWFKTHYLNQWCVDDDLLILGYNRSFHRCDPVDLNGWHYILGVDLGYNDANSFSIVAFSYTSPVCYLVKSYKIPKLIFTEVGEQINQLKGYYPFFKIVIDGANKQGVEEMKKRMGLNLDTAEKQGKPTYLKLLKDDIVSKRFKVFNNGDCEDFENEAEALQWKDKAQLKEDDRCENHCCDSVLYAWREATHYCYRPEKKPASRDSEEYMDEMAEKEAEAEIERIKDLREEYEY